MTDIIEENICRFSPMERVQVIKGDQLVLDPGGKPRILTIRRIDEHFIHLYQVSVPFSLEGQACAKIGMFWYNCNLKSIE